MTDNLDTPCRTDPDEWHPTSEPTQAQAKAMCAGCSLTEVCLQAALDFEGGSTAAGRFGVWGGTTPTQRALMSRRRRRNPGPKPGITPPREPTGGGRALHHPRPRTIAGRRIG